MNIFAAKLRFHVFIVNSCVFVAIPSCSVKRVFHNVVVIECKAMTYRNKIDFFSMLPIVMCLHTVYGETLWVSKKNLWQYIEMGARDVLHLFTVLYEAWLLHMLSYSMLRCVSVTAFLRILFKATQEDKTHKNSDLGALISFCMSFAWRINLINR